MPFKSTIRIPSEVLDAIVSLTELTTSFAIDTTMEAGRQHAYGDPKLAEARLNELADGVDAATGEVTQLVRELDAADDGDRGVRADAATAIAGLQQTRASAASLRRSAEQLGAPLAVVRLS